MRALPVIGAALLVITAAVIYYAPLLGTSAGNASVADLLELCSHERFEGDYCGTALGIASASTVLGTVGVILVVFGVIKSRRGWEQWPRH